ncbi:arsenate reductase (glutaredoxin) [Woodsholea maritima]|uniref:arsenate reductase (glutaredoxin) n=1 Tax=Woodsholea maritima TaxID=240237 RepID=UPI000375B8FE|nr:arsenate reductase (glutaredoxin) [Woodsholea maritima]
MATEIWHNPRCSKSRETLALLRQHAIEPKVRLYMEEKASVEDIRTVLGQLGFEDARQLMRTKEAAYKDLGLGEVSDQDALIQAMHDEPKLIERPIVIHRARAMLGRPPERVLVLFNS